MGFRIFQAGAAVHALLGTVGLVTRVLILGLTSLRARVDEAHIYAYIIFIFISTA